MTKDEAISKVYNQFIKINPVGINSVNKKAVTVDSFKEDVYEWMREKIPEEYHHICWQNLYYSAWDYDILTSLIRDDGTVSDIACHAWNNVWVQELGEWKECDFHFRDEEHFRRFFNHVCMMNNKTINERNATDNCTDTTTCADFRLRLNFAHKSINTNGSNVFSIRKIPTHKKTFDVLTSPRERMLTPDMVPIVEKHIKSATGILVVGMGGSGKTTFLNAVIEVLPKEWKYLFIQENEELYSYTRRNADFFRTVRGINQYDVSHDLKELARNGLLMSTKCFVIGEIKGEEALYLMNATNTGAVGMASLHSDSSRHALDKLCDYIKYASDYTKDQCMQMLTVINKIFFLEHYRLREISTVRGYDSDKHEAIMDTEYYNPNPWKEVT